MGLYPSARIMELDKEPATTLLVKNKENASRASIAVSLIGFFLYRR